MFSRCLSRTTRTTNVIGCCRSVISRRLDPFCVSDSSHSSGEPALKVSSCREPSSWITPVWIGSTHHIHHQSSSLVEERLDPFSLVADELSLLANKLREMVVAEVPKLASAAEYFFKIGVEGKRFRPTTMIGTFPHMKFVTCL